MTKDQAMVIVEACCGVRKCPPSMNPWVWLQSEMGITPWYTRWADLLRDAADALDKED